MRVSLIYGLVTAPLLGKTAFCAHDHYLGIKLSKGKAEKNPHGPGKTIEVTAIPRKIVVDEVIVNRALPYNRIGVKLAKKIGARSKGDTVWIQMSQAAIDLACI